MLAGPGADRRPRGAGGHCSWKLEKRAAEASQRLRKALETLRDEFDCIGDVRGRGLLLGVEIVKDKESRKPDTALGARITDKAMESSAFR